ncbi:MAG: GNAT family N-acetyltransferase [Streptosporangiaceae bacterium]|nr:GNAT family N-acetyltransferase [Streptosporangiaceae bacterium]
MSGAVLRLRPATQDEFDEWLPRQEAGYVEHIIASGSLPPGQAREKARRDTERAFGGGLGTPGQLVFRLLAEDEPVGWLWLAVPGSDADPRNPRMAWINDVEVDEAFRGRGYGRQAMLLAEQEAKVRGMTSIGLNVHGHNTVARALYDSLGYQVMTQQMKKPL